MGTVAHLFLQVFFLFLMDGISGYTMRTPDGKPVRLPGFDNPIELKHPCETASFSTDPTLFGLCTPEKKRELKEKEEMAKKQDEARERREQEERRIQRNLEKQFQSSASK